MTEIRAELSHQVLVATQWPLFDIRITRLDEQQWLIHFSLDALALDLASIMILSEELNALYAVPNKELPAMGIYFRDYVLTECKLQQSHLYLEAQQYWRKRLDSLPPSADLPLACDPSELLSPRFERHSHRLSKALWSRLKERVAKLRISPNTLITGCFAQILKRWSRTSHFVINFTLFNRLHLHPKVSELVGDFTSLTLLEVDFTDAQAGFAQKLAEVQRQLWADLEHKYFTGVEVQRELSRLQSRTVTFPVVVTSTLGIGNQIDEASPFDRNEIYTISQTPQVWLDFQVSEVEGGLWCNWDSVRGLFPEGMLGAMFAGFTGLLETLAEREEWVGVEEGLLPEAQRDLLARVNATWVDVLEGFSGLARLHGPVLAQMDRRAEKTAVVAWDRCLSYRELGVASERLAVRLRAGGAVPNRLVAVVMEKGWEQVVAVLGILRSGAAYLPIDASLPSERIAQLLRLGEVEQVVTVAAVQASGVLDAALSVELVDEGLLAEIGLQETQIESPYQAEGDLAYVIFTSGSTGMPKGVMIDHRGALNTVLDINRRYNVTAEDTVLGLSSLSFDLSVYDIFGVLGAGGTLVLPRPEDSRDPEAWWRCIQKERVNVWNTVPALMQMLTEYAESRGEGLPLRLVMLSGDWIPTDLPDRVRALAPAVELISLGGATEASIWSIAYRIGEVDRAWRSIPYGMALANQRFYVLKAGLEAAPVWVVGELYIGGIGLALGYWRDDEKTAERFVVHPATGERLYRTGDLGRVLPDGNIEFLGREDQQVKVQGYRIELGEIEARLKAHPKVREAVMSTYEAGRGKASSWWRMW